MFLKYKKVTLYSFDECQIYLVKYFYLMFLAHCKTQTCNKKAFKLKSNNSVTLHLNVKPPNFELQLTIKKKLYKVITRHLIKLGSINGLLESTLLVTPETM